MSFAPRDLRNRGAVVVGGTSGIGLMLARGLADAGANVIATGRRQDLVESATAQIRAAGVRSVPIASDVTSRDSLEHLLSGARQEFGAVDILVNCAGKTRRTPTL